MARYFDGSDDRIDFTVPFNVTGGTTLSVAFWIYVTEQKSRNQYVINFGYNNDYGCLIYFPSDTLFPRFWHSNTSLGSYVWRYGSATLAGIWRHYVVTWDGSSTSTNINWYRNGSSANSTNGGDGGTALTTNDDLMIAGRQSDNTLNFQGRLAEIAIWDVVLNSDEANACYWTNPWRVRHSSLQFYAPFFGYPTAEPDYIGQQVGTHNSAPTIEDHPWSTSILGRHKILYSFGYSGPIYTGSGTPTAGAATASGSGTFAFDFSSAYSNGFDTGAGGSTYTGSGTPTAGAATASGSGTFTAPVYTGSGTPTAGAATASGSGTFTAPVYTGSGTPTAGAATASGSGTFGPDTSTGTAAATAGAATASGSGQFISLKTGEGTATIGAVTASGSGTFELVFTGSAALTIPVATALGVGDYNAASLSQGSAVLSLSPVTATGTGTFAVFVGHPFTRRVDRSESPTRRRTEGRSPVFPHRAKPDEHGRERLPAR